MPTIKRPVLGEETQVTDDQVLDLLTETVREELDDDTVALAADTKASDVDGWDSLAHVRIMIAVERRFDVQFSTSEITTLKDVGSLVDMIQRKRQD